MAARYTISFAARTDSGAFAAIDSASSCTDSWRRCPLTTRFTSPTSHARAASIGSPVSSSSSATRGGTSHGSGIAHGAPRPTLASVIAKRACSAATQRSHICARRKPPAYATPLTAAIVGFSTVDVAAEDRQEVGRRHFEPEVGHLLEVATGAERLVARAGEHEHRARRRR